MDGLINRVVASAAVDRVVPQTAIDGVITSVATDEVVPAGGFAGTTTSSIVGVNRISAAEPFTISLPLGMAVMPNILPPDN
jgi:hypothetical protein